MSLPTTPGALLGYTKHGKPIHLIAGGSQPDGDPSPTPGAPAADPTPTPPTPADPTGGPKHAAPPAPPWERDGQTFDPQRAWSLIETLRGEVNQHKTKATQYETETGQQKAARTAAEQQATQAQDRLNAILRAAGFNPDGTEAAQDPEKLAAQLAERAEAAEARIWTLGVRDAVFTQAVAAGVDPELIYEAGKFRDLLDDLTEDDPDTPAFRAAVLQKMKDFAAANPKYAHTPPPAVEPPKPTPPKPDPSQGSRGDTPTRSQGIAAAVAKAMASPK